MACSSSSSNSSEVFRKVARLKLQLEDRVETAKVLKILKKLEDLDVTVDVLSETGIGKTVNSLRRHEQAGELAKSLVRGWKKLLSKGNLSLTDHVSEVLKGKEKCGDNDINNNCKSPDSSDEAACKAPSRREKQRGEDESGKKERRNHFQSCAPENDIESDERNDFFSPKKNDNRGREGNINKEETPSRSRPKEKLRIISNRRRLEKESDKKPSKERGRKESFSFHSTDKHSKALEPSKHGDNESSGLSRSSVARKRKRKKTGREKNSECDDSKHKIKKVKEEGGGEDRDRREPQGEEKASLSFESYLNYDVNVSKRKERGGAKRPSKTARRESKSQPITKPFKAPVNVSPAQQFQRPEEPTNVPAAALPEWDKPLCFDRKESEPCDVSTGSAGVFTGQRLNKKMQVYSGAKTVFLPNMLSLHQQCIRTLQNNINMLHDTGRVPFEILEPVLERCTPEQLLHIEECNPVYIGVSDHLWGKHCQRDFKDSKLQEYESWKEMYIRLSEERERKLQRLTKSIVSAHSSKPKGRQVKMAFIHTVAKPPRDVRIQQEIHGTAIQQPQQPRSSVKIEDNKSRPSTNEPSKSSSSSSVVTSTQDQRKKTKVAPMMAKSLKAFKKQLGRR